MARGWESKSIESQQADHEDTRTTPAPLSPEETARAARRRTAEMALARARADLAGARHPRHRAMLEAAIQTLEEMLQPSPSGSHPTD